MGANRSNESKETVAKNPKFLKIKETHSFDFNFKCLVRFAILNNDTLVACDCESPSLKLIDINGNYLKSINPNKLLKCPWAIFITKTNTIFVSDSSLARIFVFNSNFELLRSFGLEDLVKFIEFICIDEEQYLYASDFHNSLVTIWDSRSGTLLKKIQINSPTEIAINEKHIFIASQSDENRLEIENGDSCIYVLNKSSYEIENKIKFANWLAPHCILFDADGNLLALALERECVKDRDDHETNFETKQCSDAAQKATSCKTFLHLIDADNFSPISKLKLPVCNISHMALMKQKLIATHGPFHPSLFFIEFD